MNFKVIRARVNVIKLMTSHPWYHYYYLNTVRDGEMMEKLFWRFFFCECLQQNMMDYIIFTDEDNFCCFNNYMLTYFLHEAADGVKIRTQASPKIIKIVVILRYELHHIHKCRRFSRAKTAVAVFPFLNINLLRNFLAISPTKYNSSNLMSYWFFNLTFLAHLKGFRYIVPPWLEVRAL